MKWKFKKKKKKQNRKYLSYIAALLKYEEQAVMGICVLIIQIRDNRERNVVDSQKQTIQTWNYKSKVFKIGISKADYSNLECVVFSVLLSILIHNMI